MPCIRHGSKGLAGGLKRATDFNPHDDPGRQPPLVSPFTHGGNWGAERFRKHPAKKWVILYRNPLGSRANALKHVPGTEVAQEAREQRETALAVEASHGLGSLEASE